MARMAARLEGIARHTATLTSMYLPRYWVFTSCAMAALLSTQEPGDDIGQKVLELSGLSPTFTRDEFLSRRAMAEIMIGGARNYDSLKRTFLESEDWSTQISLGFLLSAIKNGPDSNVTKKLSEMMKSSNVN